MWKAVGSVISGDDRSMRSNRSRLQIQAQPFHQGVRKRSTMSPASNRSFCQDYFQRHKYNTLNMTYSNRSEKNYRNTAEREDMFTEMRNKGQQQSSRVDSLKDNPEGEESTGPKASIKKTNQKLAILQRDQKKLKKTLQSQFNNFKNFFYQIEQRMHQASQLPPEPSYSSSGARMDEQLFRGILGEAMQVQKFFAQMDRKKSTIMHQLTG